MNLGLRNKVAFVAAASRGLGFAAAYELAREGASLIICARHEEALQQAAGKLEKAGNGRVLALPGNLAVAEDRKRLVETSLAEYGQVDILVTNTGGPPPGRFEELSPQHWEAAYHLLLASAVELIRGFLPGMKARKWGRIITITSQAVKQPVDNLILSNSVRASVAGLVKSLANELGSYNITVNNVMPGYTQTERLEKLMQDKSAFGRVKNEIPLGRFGRPDELAAAVAFLASERAAYITGVSLAVDGGWIKSLL